LQVLQRGVAGAEIVERTGSPQRVTETSGLLDVIERCGLGDLDDQLAGELRIGAQPRPRDRPPSATASV
jgi:hypothetical protein